MAEIQDDVAAFVRSYVALSTGKQFAAKRARWDADEPRPVLRPEEAERALVGWPAIDAYWSRSDVIMADLSTEVWDVRSNRLSAEVALVTYTQRWRATMRDAGSLLRGPIASTVRVTLGLRDRGAGWRIFFCVESHVDPVEYVRSLLRGD